MESTSSLIPREPGGQGNVELETLQISRVECNKPVVKVGAEEIRSEKGSRKVEDEVHSMTSIGLCAPNAEHGNVEDDSFRNTR